MNVYPFIEAEKQGRGNVCRACALLKVSRAAYYAWSAGAPSARRLADELARLRRYGLLIIDEVGY